MKMYESEKEQSLLRRRTLVGLVVRHPVSVDLRFEEVVEVKNFRG